MPWRSHAPEVAAKPPTKATADYRRGWSPFVCEHCKWFTPPAGCTQLAGAISTMDVCDLWQPQAGKPAAW